ncbi:YfhO family protein [uncultured Alistipes sp.]|uniref:YfhO family protein n=1 Tax=uncultured Alistipes sp. TaxID=538949 RepID=UPI00260485D0|nr:YfhO family protein [uncultured Alistipes sp.]
MDFSKENLSKTFPLAAAIVIFFVAAALYFIPQFRGEVLPQHDVIQYEGMTRDINDMRDRTGEDPQWTGGMFGGMPAYLINVEYPAQLVKNYVGKVVRWLDTPAAFLFFAMTAFWIMLLIGGVNPWVGIIPALAYGFSTYFLLIIAAGHVTKMWALVYAPLMMGGAWMTLRKDVRIGAAVTALATALEIGANHPQITYYFLVAMAALWISEAVFAFREKRTGDFVRRTAALAAAGILALGANFAPLWYTAQHSPETIRGGSELAETVETDTRGLDLDYATAWSYGKTETFNLLIPDFMGRDSATTLPADGQTAAELSDIGRSLGAPSLGSWARQLPAYWGTQPYTGGPTYLGAAALFLALLGAFWSQGRNKWWIIAVSLLMILLAWGRNFMGFTELAFKYLPGYNKFRTVSMTLVVVQWAVPLLGAFALMQLWKGGMPRERIRKGIAWAAGITGGLCLLFALAGGSLFDFGRAASADQMSDTFRQVFAANGLQSYIDRGMDAEWGDAVAQAIAADRAGMMQADAWRSLGMILLAAGCVALWAARRIGRGTAVALLAAVMLLDLVPVDRRFLSDENFVSPRRTQVTPSAADRAIMQDTEPGYRVLNLTVSPFNDATTSYFHRSVGGYHGAKLARYQDLIDRYLNDLNPAVLDMLNTRYLIVPGEDGQPRAQRRTSAFGTAWFVDSLAGAASAQEEIDLLEKANLRTTAVVDDRLAEKIEPQAPTPETLASARIGLTEYRPNYLRYEYSAPEKAVAVFSEIYYDKGWTAYVDGKESPYFRADYVLRAMELPAGKHVVEWRFRAPGWNTVEAVTGICSALILLGAAAAIVYAFRKKKHLCHER